MKSTCLRLLRFVECASWAFGLAGLMWWGAFQLDVATSAKDDLRHFEAVRLAKEDPSTTDTPAPAAVLRIPKIGLEVSVLPGTDERTLDRAVGHIEGTAQPGTDGNLAIAGHRDGFFRGLKDIAPGDLIELDTLQGKDTYRVERTWVVNPEDVSVLDPTSTRVLTLVTCYPFYFVGEAPYRFIVRAVQVATDLSHNFRQSEGERV